MGISIRIKNNQWKHPNASFPVSVISLINKQIETYILKPKLGRSCRHICGDMVMNQRLTEFLFTIVSHL